MVPKNGTILGDSATGDIGDTPAIAMLASNSSFCRRYAERTGTTEIFTRNRN